MKSKHHRVVKQCLTLLEMREVSQVAIPAKQVKFMAFKMVEDDGCCLCMSMKSNAEEETSIVNKTNLNVLSKILP